MRQFLCFITVIALLIVTIPSFAESNKSYNLKLTKELHTVTKSPEQLIALDNSYLAAFAVLVYCDLVKADQQKQIVLIEGQPAATVVYTSMSLHNDYNDCLIQLNYSTGKNEYHYILVNYRQLSAPQQNWKEQKASSLTDVRSPGFVLHNGSSKLSKEEQKKLYYHEISAIDFANMYISLITVK